MLKKILLIPFFCFLQPVIGMEVLSSNKMILPLQILYDEESLAIAVAQGKHREVLANYMLKPGLQDTSNVDIARTEVSFERLVEYTHNRLLGIIRPAKLITEPNKKWPMLDHLNEPLDETIVRCLSFYKKLYDTMLPKKKEDSMKLLQEQVAHALMYLLYIDSFYAKNDSSCSITQNNVRRLFFTSLWMAHDMVGGDYSLPVRSYGFSDERVNFFYLVMRKELFRLIESSNMPMRLTDDEYKDFLHDLVTI